MNRKWRVCILAILLISAFVLHAVSFDHHHPWDVAGGDRVQAALHGDNKKWLLDAVAILGFSGGVFDLEFFVRTAALKRSFAAQTRLFDPLRIALGDGIMHPKLCA